MQLTLADEQNYSVKLSLKNIALFEHYKTISVQLSNYRELHFKTNNLNLTIVVYS